MKRQWNKNHGKETCCVCGKKIEPRENMLVIRFTSEFEVCCEKHGKELEEMYRKEE